MPMFKKGDLLDCIIIYYQPVSQTHYCFQGDSTEPKKNIQIIDGCDYTTNEDFSKVQYSITVKDTTVYQLEDFMGTKKNGFAVAPPVYNNDLFEKNLWLSNRNEF